MTKFFNIDSLDHIILEDEYLVIKVPAKPGPHPLSKEIL